MPEKKPSQPSTSASFYSPRGIEAARDEIVDPVFGTLKDTPGGLFWRGRYESPKFGRVVLHVDRRKKVSDEQRNAFSLFKANDEQIFKDAQEFLFNEYNYVVSGDSELLEELSPLARSEQVWGQLSKPFQGGTTLIVEKSRERTVFLRLAWNCKWDVEHGTSVCIENGEVVSRRRGLELE